jgi:hypothetical protein
MRSSNRLIKIRPDINKELRERWERNEREEEERRGEGGEEAEEELRGRARKKVREKKRRKGVVLICCIVGVFKGWHQLLRHLRRSICR